MSIEQKISELLEEGKKLTAESAVAEADEQVVEEIEETTEEVVDVATEETEEVVDEAEEATDEAEVEEVVEEEITVDVSEDVAALLNGEELSEDFQAKAKTIFEAAVISRVKVETKKIEESFASKLEEATQEIQEGLVEKVDGYLGLMVEQWMEQNELALESGMKSEVLESFVNGLKNVFEEHYIDIPEDKFDLMGEMESRIDDLDTKLNESVESNVELRKELSAIKRAVAIEESAEGLTDTEAEKFKGLAEELSYEDVDSFTTKLQTIRENYFGNGKATTDVNSVVTDEPIVEEKVLRGPISDYVKALGKTTF